MCDDTNKSKLTDVDMDVELGGAQSPDMFEHLHFSGDPNVLMKPVPRGQKLWRSY